MSRPIVHIEPQLATASGHFARFALAFARACARTGRRYAVAAHPALDPAIASSLRAEGAEILQVATSRGAALSLLDLWLGGREFRRDLARLASAYPDAHLLLPSAGPAMLWAAAGLPARDARRTAVQILGPDRLHAEGAPTDDAAWAVRRAAATFARKGGRIGGQTEICADRLATVLRTPAEAWPMIYEWSRPMPERPARRRPRVGTINLSRTVKEAGLVTAAAAATADVVDWRIHLGGRSGAQRRGREMPSPGPGIEIVEGVLDERAYAEFIESVDFVVMPYPPEIYAHKGSGVLFEAVACGAVPIVPEGTFMAKMLAGTGAGAVFAPFTSEALIATLRDAVLHRDTLAAAARALGRQWRIDHTAPAFLAAIDADPARGAGTHAAA